MWLEKTWCELMWIVGCGQRCSDGTEEWPKWTIPFGWALNSSGEIKTKAPEFYWWRDICAGNSEMGNCWFAVDSLLDHFWSFTIISWSVMIILTGYSHVEFRSFSHASEICRGMVQIPLLRSSMQASLWYLWSAFCWQKTLEISQHGLARSRS